MLDIAAVCLVVTALLAYVNHRFVGLPTAIGVMVIALGISLAIIALDVLGISHVPLRYEESLLRSIDFSEVLMQGMLSLLLFAGALHVDLRELHARRWTVGGLAIVGTVLSTLAVGYGMFIALPWVGLQLPLVWCLLFGALISPTDPIAVMGILKSAGTEAAGTGDCRRVVVQRRGGRGHLHLAAGCAGQRHQPHAGRRRHAAAARGRRRAAVWPGAGLHHLPAAKKHRQLPGRGVADTGRSDRRLCAGAPPARVGPAGHGGGGPDDRQPRPRPGDVGHHTPLRRHVLGSDRRDPQRRAVRAHWHGSSAGAFFRRHRFCGHTGGDRHAFGPQPHRWPAGALAQALLETSAWCLETADLGGLRGGISVALVLSLPSGPERSVLLSLTYCVVVFSILVQGLSVGRVARRVVAQNPDAK